MSGWIYTTPFSGHWTSAKPIVTSSAPPYYGSATFKWTIEDQLKHIINNYKDDLSPEDVKALNQIINKNIVKNI